MLVELSWFLEAGYINRLHLIWQQTSDNITALSSSNHKPDIIGLDFQALVLRRRSGHVADNVINSIRVASCCGTGKGIRQFRFHILGLTIRTQVKKNN